MDKEIYCFKHEVSPDDEKWKVVFEELIEHEREDTGEPFKGLVCPICYLQLRDRVRELKRNLKVESREAVSLRQDNDQLKKLVDLVVDTVKQLTGKDAYQLASQNFPVSAMCPEYRVNSSLFNILPNLIAEAINAGVKK
jgi:hypothetical protein